MTFDYKSNSTGLSANLIKSLNADTTNASLTGASMSKKRFRLAKFFIPFSYKSLRKNVLWGLTSTVLCLISESAYALPKFYLPFSAGTQYQVTQGWNNAGGSHFDEYNRYAVDFGMSVGQPVAATAPGKVIRSSKGLKDRIGACNRNYVNQAHYVVIDHGENVSSLYLHLNEVNVSVGDTIKQGDIVGKSGNTGWVCGDHLHFSFQKTNTTGIYAGESIPIGFVETGNNPQVGKKYTSQNSASDSFSNSFRTIISKATSKALDAGGAGGNQVYLNGSPNQTNDFHLWKLEKAGDFYMLISKATGKALDAGGAGGDQVYLNGNPNQTNDFHLWSLKGL